ncbi:MAG: hypothetical protein H6867_10640 [Rhodospirillales bacterium]|nr:hypothetical protein [Rhodospirillales bacterium]MCB9995760.1 hypothetical protein [Rhodospirillales bacterium]
MTLSASDRIDRILPGRQICPLDFINLPIHYDPRPEPGTEYTQRLTDAAKMSYVAANEMGFGIQDRLAFRASGMSNGALAYGLVEDYASDPAQGFKKIHLNNIISLAMRRFGKAVKTTQNLKNTVAGSELLNRVILPNREADYRAGNLMESTYPDQAWVYPIGYENAVRMQKSSNALSQGASYQDWTFEYWWGARVVDMNTFVYDGEKRFDSRNLGIEDNMANLIQLGYLDKVREHVGPGKNFDVLDRHGNHVPLTDRAWGRAKHVFERTEQGYASDLAISVLLGEFMIDDWLRGKSAPAEFDAPDMKKVHPVLAKRSPEELARMDRLKEVMLPYIAEKCLDFQPFYQEDPNLKKYIEEVVIPAKGQFKDLKLADVQKALFSEDILGDMNSSDIRKEKNAAAKAFDTAANDNGFLSKPAKRRDTDGHYFKTPSRLFNDDDYGQLSLWEQAALPYMMGAMESFRLPENAPRSLFYVAEPKGGPLAEAYMGKHKLDWLKEAYSAEDQVDSKHSFAQDVIAKNKQKHPKNLAKLAKSDALGKRGIANIVSSQNFINIAEAAEKYRNFVAAAGPQKISPRARLALMKEWMHRNPQAIALRKGWETHHDETQLALEALKIATGLVDRPYDGGNFKMEIFVFDEKSGSLEKQSLYDLVTTLGNAVEAKLDKDVPPPAREHYLALARMLRILDAYKDPGGMNVRVYKDRTDADTEKDELIQWRNADPALMAFMHEDMDKKNELNELRTRLREKLLAGAVQYFDQSDLEGLDQKYEAAWKKAHGDDASAQRRKYDGRKTTQKWEGPT